MDDTKIDWGEPSKGDPIEKINKIKLEVEALGHEYTRTTIALDYCSTCEFGFWAGLGYKQCPNDGTVLKRRLAEVLV